MSEPSARDINRWLHTPEPRLPADHSKCGPGPGTVAYEMMEWEMHFGRVLALNILSEVRCLRMDPTNWGPDHTWEEHAKRTLRICEELYASHQEEQLRVSQLSAREIHLLLPSMGYKRIKGPGD